MSEREDEKGRVYAVSFETYVEVVNADEFTDEEIEAALRRDLEREVSDNGTRDERTTVHAMRAARPHYGLRLVRGAYGFIDAQHPDDPVPAPTPTGGG